MKGKIIPILVITLLIIVAVLPIQGSNMVKTSQRKNMVESYKYLFQNDVITPPDTEKTNMNRSPEPGYFDTSEYMIGSVALGIIFLESDGSIDPSTEDWTPQEKTAALGALGISGGYQSWVAWFISEGLNYHFLNFYSEDHTIEISYEPIIHPSGITDDTYEKLYIAEAMDKLGYTSGDWMQRVRDYNNYIRNITATGTDWAFTVFLVDNSNDADGLFSDGYHAYAYLGGPFTVCPHIIPGGSPPYLREVFAHETGHIFYATDEYNGQPDYSGYLNAQDVENSGCLMDDLTLCLSSGTKEQVGWKDTDSDQKADILDTFPDTTLTPYTPDPSPDPTPTYSGSGTVLPYPNNNPNGPGNDVTTNWIAFTEYRVDGSMWYTDVFPDDGQWDDPVEPFTFTTILLSDGTHTIEVRATNSIANSDQTPASDTLTIIAGNQPPNKPVIPTGPASGKIWTIYTYSSSTTDPENEQIYYWFEWGDGFNSGWLGPYNSGQIASASHMWVLPGNYQIKVKAKDINNAESVWSDPCPVTMPRNRAIQNTMFQWLLEQFPILHWLFQRLI